MRPVLLLVLVSFAACRGGSAPPGSATPQTLDASLRERCCEQCAAAAARDPAGMDIRGKTCTSYPFEWHGGRGVDDECRAWFVAQPRPTLVADCEGAAPR
jgi:hypothetical protein